MDDLVACAQAVYEKSISEINCWGELYGDLVHLLCDVSPYFYEESKAEIVKTDVEAFSLKKAEIDKQIEKLEADGGDSKDFKKKAMKDLEKDFKDTFSNRHVTRFRTVFVDILEDTFQRFTNREYEKFDDCDLANSEFSTMEDVKDDFRNMILSKKRERLKNSLKFFGELLLRSLIPNKLFTNLLNEMVLNYEFTGETTNRENENFRVMLFCTLAEQIGTKMDSFKDTNDWLAKLVELKDTHEGLDQMTYYAILNLIEAREAGWRVKANTKQSQGARSKQSVATDHVRDLLSTNMHKNVQKAQEIALKAGLNFAEIKNTMHTGEQDELITMGESENHVYKAYYLEIICQLEIEWSGHGNMAMLQRIWNGSNEDSTLTAVKVANKADPQV